MTTNQTIDGVPREQMISFPRELDDEMAEILAEKARVCGAGAFDIWELLCARFGTETASQPQREPVSWMRPNQGGMCISNEVKQHSIKLGGAPASAVAGYSIPLHAEQPAPVAVVPDGYCIMPRQLTAENGAKALLLGEFKLLVTKECPECCELEEPVEGCSICDGEGEYGQRHTISWDQIKFIYSKAVSGLAVKAESAKSR